MLQEAVQGVRVQARVIHALILREVRTRFGQFQLGYLWAVFVPLAFILVLAFLYGALGRRSAHGAPVEVLLLSGMMVWLTFADVLRLVSVAYQQNRPLMVYPMVSVADVVIARVLLEFATKVSATLILMCLFMAAGVEQVPIDDPLALLGAVVAITYLAAMAGHIVGCIAVIAPSVQFVMLAIRRLLFFTSGALFLLADIPEDWRWAVLLNPLAHLIDYGRGAWIASYSAPYANLGYVAEWAIGLTAAAMVAEAAIRRRRSGAMQ